MAYMVSQMRKEISGVNYMTLITSMLSETKINSPNNFGLTSVNSDDSTVSQFYFEDFALAGNFEKDHVYYLRFKIRKIPQYFYSGSRTEEEISLYQADADSLNLQILLKNNGEDDEEKNPPQIIGTCSVPTTTSPNALDDDAEPEYSFFSFIFIPSKNFNRLGFRINRVSYDAIHHNDGYRNWLAGHVGQEQDEFERTHNVIKPNGDEKSVTINYPRIIWNGEDGEISELQNLMGESKATNWLKFGYQSRPGSIIVVNKVPIRIGRSGIYLLNNGTIISDFRIAAPGGSNPSKIDAFLLDYAYKTTSNSSSKNSLG